jgi:hypothetical protein
MTGSIFSVVSAQAAAMDARNRARKSRIPGWGIGMARNFRRMDHIIASQYELSPQYAPSSSILVNETGKIRCGITVLESPMK